REQAGLAEDSLGRAGHVLEGRCAPERRELLAGHAVPPFRFVAEREQRLTTADGGTGTRNGKSLIDRQVRALPTSRRLGEGAVVTDVAAELRQRDEDLRRVGHEAAVSLNAKRPSFGAQIHQRPLEQLHLQELTLRACCYETTRRSS